MADHLKIFGTREHDGKYTDVAVSEKNPLPIVIVGGSCDSCPNKDRIAELEDRIAKLEAAKPAARSAKAN